MRYGFLGVSLLVAALVAWPVGDGGSRAVADSWNSADGTRPICCFRRRPPSCAMPGPALVMPGPDCSYFERKPRALDFDWPPENQHVMSSFTACAHDTTDSAPTGEVFDPSNENSFTLGAVTPLGSSGTVYYWTVAINGALPGQTTLRISPAQIGAGSKDRHIVYDDKGVASCPNGCPPTIRPPALMEPGTLEHLSGEKLRILSYFPAVLHGMPEIVTGTTTGAGHKEWAYGVLIPKSTLLQTGDLTRYKGRFRSLPGNLWEVTFPTNRLEPGTYIMRIRRAVHGQAHYDERDITVLGL